MSTRGSFTHGGFAGSNICDVAQEAQTRANEAALNRIKKLESASVDFGEMPLLKTKDSQGKICEFAVSFTQGFVQLKPNLLQIGIQAPIGRFIKDNWPNVKVGDILPNGATVISVGTITLPKNFKPSKT